MTLTTNVETSDVYFDQERPEVLAIVPNDASRVLELGCANGRLAAALKTRQQCHVTGVESCVAAAERAEARLDRVIVGDCEQLDLDEHFQAAEFDCLIAADVLEHLRDPEALLRRLLPFLSSNACVVVSMPNVRHAGVLESAVQGDWTYQQLGILDRTHLRFYTRREIESLFARLGFGVEEEQTVDDPRLADWQQLGRPTSVSFGALTVDGLTEQEIREFFVVQWLVRLRRKGSDPPRDSRESTELAGVAPPFSVARSAMHELRSQLVQEREHAERLHGELARAKDELGEQASELAARATELAARANETESLRHQLLQSATEYTQLQAAYAEVLSGRDLAGARLEAVLGSTSWRVTAPLRAATKRHPALRQAVGRFASYSPAGRRLARRIARLMWLALTLRLPGRIAARLRARPRAALDNVAPVTTDSGVRPPTFRLSPIHRSAELESIPSVTKGRLICLTHVLPYPPRAGNEYRIDRMLKWLSDQGWDVLLLVCPLSAEPITDDLLAEAAQRYRNLIVCERDGTLHYRLLDNGAMLQGLGGHQPRAFASMLHEKENGTEAERDLLDLLRTFCPDVLAEVLMHLQSEFRPGVLLAEYVFMTRLFPLLRPGVVKVIDTIDVFSTKNAKVEKYGIADRLAISTRAEASLLNRADIIVAIQADEADSLRRLAPRRRVITVGVDFPAVNEVGAPPTAPVVLLVGSSNPLNVKGLKDFLRFAWPLVRASVPQAQLHVVGAVSDAADPGLPGVRVLGRMENLDAAYAAARVVINPAIAGTGLKIKTVEAICHLRPVVLWPAGVDGLGRETRSLCDVACDWSDFARKVINRLIAEDSAVLSIEHRTKLNGLFGPEHVYAPLGAALASP